MQQAEERRIEEAVEQNDVAIRVRGLRNSFGDHRAEPGKILLNEQTPAWVRKELENMGYAPIYRDKTSGPINAIEIDQQARREGYPSLYQSCLSRVLDGSTSLEEVNRISKE